MKSVHVGILFLITIVHELGHRLLTANDTRALGAKAHMNIHKVLYLFLFDVYKTLFGQAKALAITEWESSCALVTAIAGTGR